jgi:site-specific DNA-methyltransferase (adenine-specific)
VKAPVDKATFNLECRFKNERTNDDSDYGSYNKNFVDREDVWEIRREFKQKQEKNVNELPSELLDKIIQYSSNENDVVLDPFSGSGTTCKMAKKNNRKFIGIDISEEYCKLAESIIAKY